MDKKYEIELEDKIALEDYNKLVETERESSNTLDKTLVTLSSGALVLSTTFLAQVFNLEKPQELYFLYYSWLSFLLTISFTLFGYFCSIYSHRFSSNIQWRYFLNPNRKEKDDPDYLKYIFFSKLLTPLNILSFISFIIGSIFLFYFCFLNFEIKYNIDKPVIESLAKK